MKNLDLEYLMEANKSGDNSLHDWFNKSKSSDGTKGWVQLGGKFAGKPCARQPGQTSTPKCGSSKMKRNLSKKEEERAFRRKNRQDPNQPNKSGGAKPTNVKTEGKTYKEFTELQEAKLATLGTRFLRYKGKEAADDQLKQAASRGRSKAGAVGDAVNKVSSTASDVQGARELGSIARQGAQYATQKLRTIAPKAAQAVSKVVKPISQATRTASQVAGKAIKPISKVVGNKVLGPASVGMGIADATFRNPAVVKAYQNYKPPISFAKK